MPDLWLTDLVTVLMLLRTALMAGTSTDASVAHKEPKSLKIYGCKSIAALLLPSMYIGTD